MIKGVKEVSDSVRRVNDGGDCGDEDGDDSILHITVYQIMVS